MPASSGRAESFRDLIVWQKAMDLVLRIYDITGRWPGTEQFGLTAQIRRAAVSVPSNFAEGQGRIGTAEFQRFAGIAHGSLCEVETQLLLANRLGYMSEDELSNVMVLVFEIGRMTRSMIRKGNSRFT